MIQSLRSSALMVSKIPKIRLSNGVLMPQLGLGTFLAKPEEIRRSVIAAIDAGYRHIDTAELYKNESEIGDALQEVYKTRGVRRGDLFITSKPWCNHNRPDDMEATLRNSLRDLRTDYVDLYLVHMPASYTSDGKEFDRSITVEDTWKSMERLYHAGLTRAIGVCNFSNEQIRRVMSVAEVPIHVSQVEIHLYFNQKRHVDFCHANGIAVTAFGPLGAPGRHAYRNDSVKTDEQWAHTDQPMDDPFVQQLAKKYRKPAANILLRWLLQRQIIVIPKSINPERVAANAENFDFSLTNEEMAKLNRSQQSPPFYALDLMAGHPEDSMAGVRNIEPIQSRL